MKYKWNSGKTAHLNLQSLFLLIFLQQYEMGKHRDIISSPLWWLKWTLAEFQLAGWTSDLEVFAFSIQPVSDDPLRFFKGIRPRRGPRSLRINLIKAVWAPFLGLWSEGTSKCLKGLLLKRNKDVKYFYWIVSARLFRDTLNNQV